MSTTTTLATVEFHGARLITTLIDGEPHVAMRPICEAIGLDWAGQFSRIKRDPVLTSTVGVMPTVADDGKTRDMVAIPVKYLNGWLFGVDASRVKPEAKERLLAYQRECFDVLANYWQKGSAINPRAPQPALVGKSTGLPLAQLTGLQDQVHKLITRLKGETGADLRGLYYRQLQAACADLGQDPPPLAAIGSEAPAQPAAAGEFWKVYQALLAAGVQVNHSRNPGVIAVNLKQFAQVAAAHGMRLAQGPALKDALRHSRAPLFLDVRTVNSAVLGNTIHCWTFQAMEGGAA